MVRKILVLATILAGGCNAAAQAADLDSLTAPLADAQPAEMTSLFGSGWYIRGDIGYSVPMGPGGSLDGTKLSDVSWSNSATVGAGAGYKFNTWLRGDVTVDYLFERSLHYFGTDPTTGDLFRNSTTLGGYTLMANGYLDLGTWSRITPYIGAGAGYAFMQNTYVWNVLLQQTGTGFTPAINPFTGAAEITPYQGGWRDSFAWALMAGAAIDLMPGLKLDLGYRYLNIADGNLVTVGTAFPTKMKSLGVSQFRIGLRYNFDQ